MECFELNPKTGDHYKRCIDCLQKIRVLNKNTSGTARTERRKANSEYKRKQRESKAAKYATVEGKAKLLGIHKKWSSSQKGVAWKTAYKDSEPGKAAIERGKVTWKKNPKSKEASKRGHASRTKRKRDNPGLKLRHVLLSRLSRVINGKRQSSTTLYKYLEWTDADGIRDHFRRTLDDHWEVSDHGSLWVVAHKIPLCYFDHSKPAEVKKAWSSKNMCAMTPERNSKLGIKIVDDLCLEVGEENFPEWWNSIIPKNKKALYSRVRKNIGPWIGYDLHE